MNSDVTDEVPSSTLSPAGNETALEIAEEEHTYDAVTTLFINITLIGCLLLAYYVKKFRIYYLPESAGALLVGVVVGGIARLSTDNLALFKFSPEVFFFVLLPPIIFEAGYMLQRKNFFENVGAITLYAMVGTMISTFVVGGLSFYAAKIGIIHDVSHENPMEALLFGALISAVDPVATLSIMGNAELRCDPLLYSLVFGESVLNDAVAISLFRVFAKYYNPEGPDLSESEIPSALLSFVTVTICSIGVGVALGLAASFLYKHTSLSDYPHLETSLLFCFCYLCYSTSEAVGWSGIMSIFFQGMVLSHYNSYNLSPTAHVASEQIFSTLATIAETIVFLYMGMGVFTGKFSKYDFFFSILALTFCVIGRFLNIFPLSWLANMTRNRTTTSSQRNGFDRSQHSDSSNLSYTADGNRRITLKMQVVLWFAGLRGAIAFALAMNMPGPNAEVYATATLFICIFTTVVCGGLTDRILTEYGMKLPNDDDGSDDEEEMRLGSLTFDPRPQPLPTSSTFPLARRTSQRVYSGVKRLWQQVDEDILKVYFGGSTPVQSPSHPFRSNNDHLGNYELSSGIDSSHNEDYDSDEGQEGNFVHG